MKQHSHEATFTRSNIHTKQNSHEATFKWSNIHM